MIDTDFWDILSTHNEISGADKEWILSHVDIEHTELIKKSDTVYVKVCFNNETNVLLSPKECLAALRNEKAANDGG